jgi:hypothetical protein
VKPGVFTTHFLRQMLTIPDLAQASDHRPAYAEFLEFVFLVVLDVHLGNCQCYCQIETRRPKFSSRGLCQ